MFTYLPWVHCSQDVLLVQGYLLLPNINSINYIYTGINKLTGKPAFPLGPGSPLSPCGPYNYDIMWWRINKHGFHLPVHLDLQVDHQLQDLHLLPEIMINRKRLHQVTYIISRNTIIAGVSFNSRITLQTLKWY